MPQNPSVCGNDLRILLNNVSALARSQTMNAVSAAAFNARSHKHTR